MPGPAVTVVESGGLPVRSVESGAPAMTVVETGGLAVTVSERGTPFVLEGYGGGEEPDYGDGAPPLAAGTVSWTGAGTSDVGGWLTASGGGSGAIADGALDATLPIALTVQFSRVDASDNSNAVAVILADNDAADYVWDADIDILLATYIYGADLYRHLTQPDMQQIAGVAIADQGRIRLRNDGDDIVLYTLAGEVETEVYRATDRLAGQTALYLKVIFLEAGAQRRIKVTAEAQA